MDNFLDELQAQCKKAEDLAAEGKTPLFFAKEDL